MNQMKRQWSHLNTAEGDTKRFRFDLSCSESISTEKKTAISRIENLPNEIFYEIFDYLEGSHLYEAFTDLNSRFQNLLEYSSFRTKIGNFSSLIEENIQIHDFEIPYKHRTVSLEIILFDCNEEDSTLQIIPPLIDTSFIRLQFLKIHFISSDALITLLQQLIYLPKLTSLSIVGLQMNNNNIGDLYCQIFSLPVLERIEIRMDSFDDDESIDTKTSSMTCPQSKTIQYMHAIHQCSLSELFTLLSCVPSLHRLICSEIADIFPLNTYNIYNPISNLTSIYIREWSINFNGLESLLTKLTPHIEILKVTSFRYPDCLDADRWQRIITNHLPRLRILEFEHEEMIDDDFSIKIHHDWLTRFTSIFWTKRNWFLRVSIDSEIFAGIKLCYSIRTLDHSLNITSCSNHILNEQFPEILSDPHQLVVYDLPTYDDEILYVELIGPLFLQLSITCLNISYHGIYPGALIDLLQYLPHLRSLVIASLTMIHSKHLSVEESQTLRLLSKSKSINKLKFGRISHFSEIQFVLDLCPHIQYLEIDEINHNNLESFVRFILMRPSKSILYLSLISCGVSMNDVNILTALQTMVQNEGLREDYSISQSLDKIYLRRNSLSHQSL